MNSKNTLIASIILLVIGIVLFIIGKPKFEKTATYKEGKTYVDIAGALIAFAIVGFMIAYTYKYQLGK